MEVFFEVDAQTKLYRFGANFIRKSDLYVYLLQTSLVKIDYYSYEKQTQLKRNYYCKHFLFGYTKYICNCTDMSY